MTVKCDVTACPWLIGDKFCSKGYVFINGNGTCNWIYDGRGQVRPHWQEKGEVSQEKKKNGAGVGDNAKTPG